jgi:hypothetical protein
MLAPYLCSDDELLSLYDGAIRNDPVAATLAERLIAEKDEQALAVTAEALDEANRDVSTLEGRVEPLTEALADLLASPNEKHKTAARNLLESK